MIKIAKIRKSDGVVVSITRTSDKRKQLPEETDEFLFVLVDPALDTSKFYKYEQEIGLVESTPPIVPRHLIYARTRELTNTDKEVLPDRDDFEQWKEYRKKLRDLTKEGRDDVDLLIKRFPIRPTGKDIISNFRNNVKK